MKKIVYTAIALTACSLISTGAYAAGGAAGAIVGGAGNINAGHFNGTGTVIGGGLTGDYSGSTFSRMDGTSGVVSSLEANRGSVNSQAFVAGGNVVGSLAFANFSDPTNPLQNSTSYQMGANFQSSEANASPGSIFNGNSATVDAASFQNFTTGSDTTLDTNIAFGGVYADVEADWGSFDASWIAAIGGFSSW